MSPANVSIWFEIPTRDLARAKSFYDSVFGVSLKNENFGSHRLACFPGQPGQNGGCLIQGEGYEPSERAATVYIVAGDDLAAPLARVEKAGGKVVRPKTALPDGMGHFAQFLDCEGNRVGMFSQK